MALTMEEWRACEEFPGYEVSNLGRVRRGDRILSATDNGRGYPAVYPYRDGKNWARTVHKLVAAAFFPKPEGRVEIAHADGNKMNANVTNLRWATRAENLADRVAHGQSNRGSRQWRAVLTEDSVRDIRKRTAAGETQKSIAQRYAVTPSNVGAIARGKSWRWLS